MLLTAFNDNALVTYLATLVPSLTEPMKYAVVAGAVTGGGLTVIANAPNPAGQAILGRFFDGSVLPLRPAARRAVPDGRRDAGVQVAVVSRGEQTWRRAEAPRRRSNAAGRSPRAARL